MGATVKYTQRSSSGLLYYRRAFPADVQAFIPGNPRQLRKSLRGSSITAPGVIERYQAAAAEYDRLSSIGRRAKGGAFDCLDDATISYLARVFERNTHEGDEASVLKRNGEVAERGWDWFIDEYRQWRIEQDFEAAQDHWGRWARGLLDGEGILLRSGDLEGFGRLCMALNDAAIGMFRDAKRRFAGDVVAVPTAPSRPERVKDDGKVPAPGLSFSKIVENIHASPLQKLSETTKETGRTAIRYFQEAFGDLAPKEITRTIVTEWLELLAVKPCRDLAPSDRKLGLRQLVMKFEGQSVPHLSSKTIEQYLGALSARWKQAAARGAIAVDIANPFGGRKIALSPLTYEKVEFSRAELQAIFELPIFTEGERPLGGKGDASYWMPLLLLWTGARPEEIAQLLVADVVQVPDSERWLLQITDQGMHPHKGQRQLKTTSSRSGRRTFPVPDALVSLGFVEYVEHTKSLGELALFPLLRPKGKRNYLHSQWAGWWGRHLRAAGLLPAPDGSRPRKPVREFRDAWATAARASRLPREALEYIMGHSPPRATSNEVYGQRNSLGEQINDVKFVGLDLSGIKPWKSAGQSHL